MPVPSLAAFLIRLELKAPSPAIDLTNRLLNRIAGDQYGVVFQVNVHLRTNPKFWQVNSRFNRKAGIGNKVALILRLQAVHVGASAVVVFPDIVTRSMNEELAKAAFSNVGTNYAIHLPPLSLLRRLVCFHDRHPHVASSADNLPDVQHLLWNRLA